MKLLDADINSAKMRPVMDLVWARSAEMSEGEITELTGEIIAILEGWSANDLAVYLDGLESTDNLELQFKKGIWGPATRVEFYDTTR